MDPKFIKTTDTETSIAMEGLIRQNRGVHKVIAKNEMGEAWASVCINNNKPTLSGRLLPQVIFSIRMCNVNGLKETNWF